MSWVTATFLTTCRRNIKKLTRFSLNGRKFGPCHVTRKVYSTENNVNKDDIPISNIRNFCIIAHVDHGKSTLADRLLEMTGAINKSTDNKQVLDRLQVEKERGITVKAVAASLYYEYNKEMYMLNLIDTPGHVDFSNEVSRSLAACQGVILLVDANQGIQAQTVANFYLAFTAGLAIIPVLNKIDLKNADPDRVQSQLMTLFDINSDEIHRVSAKTGLGVDHLLTAIIAKVPPPTVDRSDVFRALIVDSWYNKYRGALCFIYVASGQIKVGSNVSTYLGKKSYNVKSLGILRPEEEMTDNLKAGEVGIIACNMRNSQEALVGDTIYLSGSEAQALPSFTRAKPMVFSGLYPSDQSQYVSLRSAIEKLCLNDPAVTICSDSSPALGQGWRLGFLGLLHLEVFTQRLEQEYSAQVVITAPSVTYKVTILGAKNIKKYGSSQLEISNPTDYPDQQIIAEVSEPFVMATIISPDKYLGTVLKLCMERRGTQATTTNIDNERLLLKFILPLNEIVVDFHDALKSISSGYASFDYEDYGYHVSNITKLNIIINNRVVEELSCLVHSSKAITMGRHMVTKLKELIPRQMVLVAIQAAIGGKIVAREDIKPFRKDVTAKLYGGDVTRRMKLLKQQSEGKKKMRMIANVQVPRDTFIDVLKLH